MRNPFYSIELLREGRNNRLAMMLIFYDAILALVSIIFLLVDTTSYQGSYAGSDIYRTQFFIVSLLQVAAVFLITPFLVWAYFFQDREAGTLERFSIIPGFFSRYVWSKYLLVLSVYTLLFLSSVPILSIFCVFGGIGIKEMVRLFIMLLLFAMWAGAISVFSFSAFRKALSAFTANVVIMGAFFLGTYGVVELISSIASLSENVAMLSSGLAFLCLAFMALNPISFGMGYYVAITGNNGYVTDYCAHVGIDNFSSLFIFFFYKTAGVLCILTAILFILLACSRIRHARRG